MTPSEGKEVGEWRYIGFILLAALVVVHPLLIHGCSCGHDFDFHLVSWMEAASQFSHGNLHPHWAFTPAYNAGEPRFVFYPPISWSLGALLGLLLTHLPGISPPAGWTSAPVVYTWIALTLAGLTCYRLARSVAGAGVSALVAALYVANPYMLFTAFERTAYAELLASAWIPLLLLAVLRERVTASRIAIPVALLWLTNAPAAVMGTYTLAVIAIVRMVSDLRDHGVPLRRRIRSAARLTANIASGTALGLGVAAFYILPAAFERRYVQVAMATIAGMRIDHNFLFEHTGYSPDDLLHDQVLHTASAIAVLLLATTVAILGAVLFKRRLDRHPTGLPALIVLTTGIAFLLTPLSATMWKIVPEASFLQFPWRLLAILTSVLALAMAIFLRDLRLRFSSTALAGIILAAGLTAASYHVFRQQCDPEDAPRAQLALFQSHAGIDPTDEYTPVIADNDALRPNSPPFWIASSAESLAPSGKPGSAPEHIAISLTAPEFLILNLRDYPAWHIDRNGILDPARTQRNDGLIALPMPAGKSAIDIRYSLGPDAIAGDILSSLSIGILIVLTLFRGVPETSASRVS
jgi:hypothetical protein